MESKIGDEIVVDLIQNISIIILAICIILLERKKVNKQEKTKMEEKELEFKNYKEKQQYYKNKLKEERFIWVSTEPGYTKKGVIKGRTYTKPKEVDKK